MRSSEQAGGPGGLSREQQTKLAALLRQFAQGLLTESALYHRVGGLFERSA